VGKARKMQVNTRDLRAACTSKPEHVILDLEIGDGRRAQGSVAEVQTSAVTGEISRGLPRNFTDGKIAA